MSVQERVRRSPDEIRVRLCQQLQHLILHFDRQQTPGELLEAVVLLESLPLSTSEFGVARSRVNNALRYAQSGEVGAARYELRMLMSWLREDALKQAAVAHNQRRHVFRRWA